MKNIKKKDLKIFVYIWMGIFSIIGIYPIVNYEKVNLIFIGIAFLLYIVSIINLNFFSNFYNVWMRIGEFLGRISSSIIMFFLFFGIYTPISLVLKIFSKDLLNKKINKDKSTYWIKRETQPQSMKNQF
ncbi:MAG: hypothetical protein U5K55_07080 [Aliarcobacter sp.]|nr:hypothetical protein [Aliarcobacter sp.]